MYSSSSADRYTRTYTRQQLNVTPMNGLAGPVVGRDDASVVGGVCPLNVTR